MKIKKKIVELIYFLINYKKRKENILIKLLNVN